MIFSKGQKRSPDWRDLLGNWPERMGDVTLLRVAQKFKADDPLFLH